jgi:hypothetical protein
MFIKHMPTICINRAFAVVKPNHLALNESNCSTGIPVGGNFAIPLSSKTRMKIYPPPIVLMSLAKVVIER